MLFEVTPYMGVWIETGTDTAVRRRATVTPYMGVWIETLMNVIYGQGLSHPLHGGVD